VVRFQLHFFTMLKPLAAAALLSGVVATSCATSMETSLHFTGQDGPGAGRRIVLIAGDEEYRTEETMPMLAKILSQRHGFDCTVVFPIDPETGLIDPNLQTNLPGLEALAEADLMIIGTRFRRLPADQLRWIADYLQAGKPVLGLRTATHAFAGDAETDGLRWSQFGPIVLGQGWVSHHGRHGVEGTRGVIESVHASHPILRGVTELFGPSDVYTVRNLDESATILLRGEVTETLQPGSPAVAGPKNDPMMPLAWLRTYQVPQGKAGAAFCCTAGASVDFTSEGLRRLVVNASYHLVGLEPPDLADVSYVDPFEPTFYAFVRDKDLWQRRGLRPSDFGLGQPTTPFPAIIDPRR
jgi:hypothetical protein